MYSNNLTLGLLRRAMEYSTVESTIIVCSGARGVSNESIRRASRRGQVWVRNLLLCCKLLPQAPVETPVKLHRSYALFQEVYYLQFVFYQGRALAIATSIAGGAFLTDA